MIGVGDGASNGAEVGLEFFGCFEVRFHHLGDDGGEIDSWAVYFFDEVARVLRFKFAKELISDELTDTPSAYAVRGGNDDGFDDVARDAVGSPEGSATLFALICGGVRGGEWSLSVEESLVMKSFSDS